MRTRPLADTAILTGRSLRHILRSPDTILTTAIIPLALLLLFVYVFGGAISTNAPGSYVAYMLPGILLITVASGVSYTSYRLFIDMHSGIVSRLQSMPIARSSILWAHVLTSLVAIGLSLVVVLGVGFLIGFRPSASLPGWLGAIGILLLFALCLTWVAVLAGLGAKTIDGATAFAYPLIFLPFVSSAFVPTASMPGPVRWFAEHQPATAVVETLRALLTGAEVGAQIWVALAWLVGILAIAWLLSAVVYRRTLR